MKRRALEADMRHLDSFRAMVDGLARHWWMLAVRGVLAIALVFALVAWPDAKLDRVLVVFAAYAALDGVWTLISAARLARDGLPAWPVGIEGLVSVALAGIALGWPLVPRDVVQLIGVWGVLTGILEITWAGQLAFQHPFRGLLVTAGASSVLLGGFVLALPHAYLATVVWAMAAYACVFGVAILAAAWCSRREMPTAHRGAP
jgi:uncharacterized membrane protein HdeD (DUF308 family)